MRFYLTHRLLTIVLASSLLVFLLFGGWTWDGAV
jgi:hypothetical protein